LRDHPLAQQPIQSAIVARVVSSGDDFIHDRSILVLFPGWL
jgi:hypothetical protein